MTKRCPYSYRHKCKLYDFYDMGITLINAMKESDLEFVCERLDLKGLTNSETKRKVLSGMLIQQLDSSQGSVVYKELLVEIKADDLQYVCSSLDLLKLTSSMRKPVKEDLLKLLKAHVPDICNTQVGLSTRFDFEPRSMDLLKEEFKKFGSVRGMWMDKSNFIIYTIYNNEESAVNAYSSLKNGIKCEIHNRLEMTLMTRDAILNETVSLESILASSNHVKDLRIAVSVKSLFVQSCNLKFLSGILLKYGSQKSEPIYRAHDNELLYIVFF